MTGQLVWLITGASRGLGLALARRALLRGDLVVVTARNPSRFDEVLFSDPSIDRTHVHVLTLDISSPFDLLVKTMNDAVSHWGRVDVLVNNGGSYVGIGPSEELGYAVVYLNLIQVRI
jgi:NAD(P)-dependent dehydrogenase (short-subunit alcohol dehydrogenase family)